MKFTIERTAVKVPVSSLPDGSLVEYEGMKLITLGKLMNSDRIYTVNLEKFHISYFSDKDTLVENLGLVRFEE